MKLRQTNTPARADLLLCLALCFPSCAAAASADDIAEMKRAIEALHAENRALAARVVTLEAEKNRSEHAQEKAATETLPSGVENREHARLEQRVKELELAKPAQEEAVRSIIKSSVSTLGSKINESVALGGVIEMIAGRSKDFSGVSKRSIALNTAQFDFEIHVNDWTLGSLVIEYVDGANAIFPTTGGFKTGVDRINLDRASITIGDTQKFPPFVKAGRMVLPFGTSTGVHRADVLSIASPTTIDGFEMRKNAVGFGFGFPTPALAPLTPPVFIPPVKPLVINPLVSSLSKAFGYVPLPTRPKPPTLSNASLVPPIFNAAVYIYDGNALKTPNGNASPAKHVAATMGFTTKGHCGRPYDELHGSLLCPWTLGVDVDYNSSIFDSRFLEAEYRSFLDQIGFVRGMAASVKSTFGPISLVAEWNSAMKRATFVDDAGTRMSIKPRAWQLSLGYQFDWNPWVEAIGAQGTFVAIGYSESRDLAGATQVINGESSRVGFLPRRRLLLTAGEWVLDGVKVAVEYSRNWDYSINEGGTGKSANGVFTTLTYTW